MDPDRRAYFETFGFLVLPGLFDPEALATEVDDALHGAFAGTDHVNSGAAGNTFRYVPMMCERTPVSLAFIVQLAQTAADLLGTSVLPGRAKGTEYHGSTAWHRDSDGSVRSLGVACYLEPLASDSGALQVLPGSQRPEYAVAIADIIHTANPPAVTLATRPGDAIVFDERLYHASSGGSTRRQWRVDFVADIADDVDAIRRYYASQYVPGWDGGYDVDLYPSYGTTWRTLNPHWNERLADVGAYAAAAAEEAYVRQQRLA